MCSEPGAYVAAWSFGPAWKYYGLSVPCQEYVACARITVFSDQWEGKWEDFAARPMKHILALIPALQTCRAAPCSCPSWHPTEEGPQDALLDVFRRQYLNEAGRPVKWEHASSFAVLVRYVKSLELAVISVSGKNGLFVEPKTEDAAQPNGDFQVIWLPQHDFASVVHKAKVEAHCVGIARSGQRFGLRVHVSHYQQTFASVKPDAVFLSHHDASASSWTTASCMCSSGT